MKLEIMESSVKTMNCIVLSQKSVIYLSMMKLHSKAVIKSYSKPKPEHELDFHRLKALHI